MNKSYLLEYMQLGNYNKPDDAESKFRLRIGPNLDLIGQDRDCDGVNSFQEFAKIQFVSKSDFMFQISKHLKLLFSYLQTSLLINN